jgi:class 3 adenylate cyclase/tetratricopeptide (TPR) repeat protein
MALGITCLACGRASPAGANFCGGCGLQLVRDLCPGCRARLVPGDCFCTACGRAAGSTPSASAGAVPWPEERKLATILFGDIAGFSQISERLEADAVWELANEVFEPLSEEIRRRDGTVVKYIGDCIMAVFGVPRAREDDALRAVEAALAMRDRVRELSGLLSPRCGQPLSMRIGLHTGEVMVGPMAPDTRRAPDVMGSAVNVASRVESLCRPGDVVLSHATWRLVERAFQAVSLGSAELRGIDESVELFRVLGPRPEVVERAPGHGSTGPFMREAELGRLLEAFERAVNDGSAVVTRLVAASGMGKNRLIEELRHRLSSHPLGPEILGAGGTLGATATAAPLQVLGRLVRRRFGVKADEDVATARARVIAGITEAWPEADRLRARDAAEALADLAQLNERPAPDAAAPDPSANGGDRLFGAFVAWLEQLSARAPVCLFFGDLQWADEASLKFVERLVGAVRRLPVLVLLGFQPVLEDRHPSFAKTDLPVERVDLMPISSARIRQFLDALLAFVPDVPGTLLDELVARSDGNPQYAIELVRLLVDRGAITPGNEARPGAWRPERLGELALPDTVLGVLQARLDGLPPDEKALLKRASVLGRSFWLGAVTSLYDTPVDVTALLSSLEARELIGAYDGETAKEVTYRFRDHAFRDVVYRSIPRAARERWHRRIADWLEENGALWEGGHAELAGHLEAGGAPERARAHHLQAARHALSVYDDQNATLFYERALESWPAELDPAGRATALRELASGRARLGRFEDALDSLAQAQRHLVFAGVATDDAVFARIDLERARLLKEQGRLDAALESVDQGLCLVDGRPPDMLQVWLHGQRAHILSVRGEGETARGHCEIGLTMAEAIVFRDRAWDEAMAMLTNVMGGIHLRSSAMDQAERCFRRALDFVGASNQRFRINALVNLGALAFDRQDPDEASRYFAEALRFSERLNWPRYRALCASNLGEARLAAGATDEAIAHLEEARRLGAEGGFLDVLADGSRALAEARLARGETVEALDMALEAIEYAKQSGQRYFESQAHAVAMDCRLASLPADDPVSARDAAHSHFEAAVGLLRASSRPGREEEIAALEARFTSRQEAGDHEILRRDAP